MEKISDLAQAGSTGIAIALIILVGYIVKCLIPIAKVFSETLAANTKATTEMHEFLKNLNGSLRKAVDEHKK